MRRVKNQSDTVDPLPDQDPVFEALLNEALGGAAPSDQTEEILKQIRPVPAVSRPAVARLPKEPTGSGRRMKLLAWSTLLAVAASLAWIVSTAPQSEVPEEQSIAHTDRRDAETEQARADRRRPLNDPQGRGSAGEDSRNAADEAIASVDPQKRNAASDGMTGALRNDNAGRRLPMQMRDVPFANDRTASDDRPPFTAIPAMPAPPERQHGREIVAKVNAHLTAAWDALSLARAETADPAEIAKRFERTIEVSLTPEEYSVPEQLVEHIATSDGHTKVSHALVNELLGPSAASRLKPEQRSILADRVASAFAGKARFDEVIASFYMGGEDELESQASQIWLTALAGGQSVPITEQTALALLDLDLRCSRCHEHPIESGIGQQDYWQFAALFDNGLYYTQNENGQPEVRVKATESNPSEGLFFELPDGRQRVALPGVAADWLGVSGAQSIDQLSDLSSYWISNPQLAKSTINRLWKIVYGRPLVGSASDPGAPPRDENLTALRDFLAEQLRAHDFDLAAATSWILAAEPMRLKVASAMTEEKLRTASTEELLQADHQTRAFAAYSPTERRESFTSLIATATEWNGGTGIDTLPAGTTLAQPIDGRKNGSADRDAANKPGAFSQQWLRASFPAISTVTNERPDLPAQWLASLKSYDQQARHLYYAAGYWYPSRSQMQAAEILRDTSDDPSLALSQLWWAIENGAE